MRLGERACYYYVVYDDMPEYRTDLMPRITAFEYAARNGGGTVYLLRSVAPWWHRLFWRGPLG